MSTAFHDATSSCACRPFRRALFFGQQGCGLINLFMTLPMVRPRCVGRFTEVIGFDRAVGRLRVEGVNARPAGGAQLSPQCQRPLRTRNELIFPIGAVNTNWAFLGLERLRPARPS
jgi:hypothetical protein